MAAVFWLSFRRLGDGLAQSGHFDPFLAEASSALIPARGGCTAAGAAGAAAADAAAMAFCHIFFHDPPVAACAGDLIGGLMPASAIAFLADGASSTSFRPA